MGKWSPAWGYGRVGTRRVRASFAAAGSFLACQSILVGPASAASATVDGAWGYFGNPRAVHARGVTYFGFVSSRGDVGIAAFDHRTRSTRREVLSPRFGKDDHNNPSLWIRPDGRIVAFWSPHSGRFLPRNGQSRLYQRTSCRPRSIDCFGPTRLIEGNTGANRLGYTYPSPVQTPATRTVWLFWRGGDWQPAYARSRNGGRSWSRPRTLLTGGRKVYAVYAADGEDGFHVAVMPDNPTVGRNSVHYLHYRGGRWRGADGRVIGRLDQRLRLQRGDRMYPLRVNRAGNAWVLDVAEDRFGRPVVLYRVSGGPRPGYWRGHWTGRVWRQHRVVRSRRLRAGASFGGATLDHEDPRVVYLSRIRGRRTQILVAATDDDGRLWRFTPVTEPSRVPNLRPTSPLGQREGTTILWMRGHYKDFERFRTRIRVRTLPREEPEAPALKPR